MEEKAAISDWLWNALEKANDKICLLETKVVELAATHAEVQDKLSWVKASLVNSDLSLVALEAEKASLNSSLQEAQDEAITGLYQKT